MFLDFANQLVAIPTMRYRCLASPPWLPLDAECKLSVRQVLKNLRIFLRVIDTKLRYRQIIQQKNENYDNFELGALLLSVGCATCFVSRVV
jgi:hypothetical protein